MHHMFYNNGILGWIFSALHMLFPLLLLIFILSLFTRRREVFTRDYRPAPRTPLDTLKERYAGGEITREEFLRSREDILG